MNTARFLLRLPLVTFILSSLVSPAPLSKSQLVKVIRYSESNDHKGNYSYDIESADGTQKSEQGCLKFVSGKPVTVKTGKYSWISPEGIRFTVTYTADETGFHPEMTYQTVSTTTTTPSPLSEILHLQSSEISDVPISSPSEKNAAAILAAAPRPQSSRPSRPPPSGSVFSSSSSSPSPSSLSFHEYSEDQQPSYDNYDESAVHDVPVERPSSSSSSSSWSLSSSSARPIIASYNYPTPSSYHLPSNINNVYRTKQTSSSNY